MLKIIKILSILLYHIFGKQFPPEKNEKETLVVLFSNQFNEHDNPFMAGDPVAGGHPVHEEAGVSHLRPAPMVGNAGMLFTGKRHVCQDFDMLYKTFSNDTKGHGLTLTDTHIPGRGDKLTAAGTLNLFRDADHKLDANAFASRNMPDTPHLPNYNTYGGGLDYMFKDKVGASFTAAHSDFIDRNDYSLGGKLNLYRSPSSSLDFKAGLNKFDMPSMSSGQAMQS